MINNILLVNIFVTNAYIEIITIFYEHKYRKVKKFQKSVDKGMHIE
jgi:hypothetical protein